MCKVLTNSPSSSWKVYIITTKDKSLTLRLLQQYEFSIPDDHVYGLGSGKKVRGDLPVLPSVCLAA